MSKVKATLTPTLKKAKITTHIYLFILFFYILSPFTYWFYSSINERKERRKMKGKKRHNNSTANYNKIKHWKVEEKQLKYKKKIRKMMNSWIY